MKLLLVQTANVFLFTLTVPPWFSMQRIPRRWPRVAKTFGDRAKGIAANGDKSREDGDWMEGEWRENGN